MIRFKDSQRFRLKVYEIQVALRTPRDERLLSEEYIVANGDKTCICVR